MLFANLPPVSSPVATSEQDVAMAHADMVVRMVNMLQHVANVPMNAACLDAGAWKNLIVEARCGVAVRGRIGCSLT